MYRLDRPAVDLEIRNWAVARAKKSVDIFMMIQTTDEVGMRFLGALRGAQKRGVAVRFMHEGLWSGLFNFEVRGKATQILSDAGLPIPGKVICGRTSEKRRAGLGGLDMNHEKIVIVDAGTPDEIIIIGGRGHGELHLTGMLDSGFLIRPVDSTKPHVGQDYQAHFDKQWRFLSSVFTTEKSTPLSQSWIDHVEKARPTLVTNPEEKKYYDRLVEALSKPEGFGARPRRLKLLADELFPRATAWAASGIDDRMYAPNEIRDVMCDLVRRARHAEITTYVPAFTPQLLNALYDMAQKGGEAKVYTNSRASHASLFAPMGMVVEYGLEALIPLLRGTENFPGALRLFLLNHARAIRDPRLGLKATYLHRKQAVIDDVTLVGSDNFTVSASTKNQESMLLVDDADFARDTRAANDEEAGWYDEVDLEDARRQVGRRPGVLYSCARRLLRVLY